jgi:hypothetical protein
MSPASRRTPTPPIGTLIPIADCELYITLGWRLCDEPVCGFVRMMPPVSLQSASENARRQA